MPSFEGLREIWAVDFEFFAPPGDRPTPVCLVARELRSGRTLRLWQDQLMATPLPPYLTDGSSVLVAYYASAELACHLALGWPPPENIIDLFVEFRNLTNGRELPRGKSLLGALAYFGIDGMAFAEKESMRELIMRGGPWSASEQAAILDYCESDVVALSRLFPRMEQGIDVPRALIRGRYMAAAARMEHVGVPIDVSALARLRGLWPEIKRVLIAEVDAEYGVYEGGSFRTSRFESWLRSRGIHWPRLQSGSLALDDQTWKDMAKLHPALQPLRELRASLSLLRLEELEVGHDGRNRRILSAFAARTSRNQPSTTKFIFGPAVWLRGLIRPVEGYGLAYIDWCQQEFGIAAALSRDPDMARAYLSGDPYLTFAKQAGRVPHDGSKESHRVERELFKQAALAVQYGMGPDALATRIGRQASEARELLSLHRRTYPAFWRWSDAAVDYAVLNLSLPTVFGWTIHVEGDVNPRSLRNFPMQANGAEMLRLACSMVTELGIHVCAPVHDALLIEAPLEELDETVTKTQELMAEASRVVLDGVELRSDAKVIRYPDRYMDERGEKMWNTVWRILERMEAGHPRNETGAGAHTRPVSSLGSK
jgi:DNA polymerase I